MSLEESDPNYNNIISDVESIISNGIKTVLNPFINKMIDSDKQCQTITDVLKQLPEYKKLLQENTELKQNIKLNIIEPTDSLKYHIDKLQEIYIFFNNNPNILELDITNILVSIKIMLDHYNSITNVNKIIQKSSNLEDHPYNEDEEEEEEEAVEESEEEEQPDDMMKWNPLIREHNHALVLEEEEESGESEQEVVEEAEDVDSEEESVEVLEDDEEKASEPETIEEDYEEEKMLEREEQENDNIENMEYYEVVMDIENEEGEEQETSFWTTDDENGDFYELIQNGNNKQYIKIGTFKDGEPYFDD